MQFQEPLSTQECLVQITAALEQADLFFGHGTDNAWDEACWLLETLLRRQGITDLQHDTQLEPGCLQPVAALVNERIETRKPLAYLLHEAWFCGLAFYVDERVLVPRSPIAELINNRFEPLLPHAPGRILDLCTGGGCIGIACALAFPDADVVLADISPEALGVARINISKYKLERRVTLAQSDLFDNVQGSFDLIVSNPPYVGDVEYSELPPEYHQEPALGLVTGEEGLEIPLRILDRAAHYLHPEGILILETGASWPALDDRRPQLPMLWLEFGQGGEGVCMLTREQLVAATR